MARPPLTIRDLRLHWPAAEQRLEREGELVVTRDGKPVAKLIAYRPKSAARRKWSGKRHLAWLKRAYKHEPDRPSTDELLKQDRDES